MRRFASLRRRADFSRLRRRGRRVATPSLTVYASDAAPGDRRPVVGITVSKAVGNAVVRNRVRRRLAAIVHERIGGRRLRMLLVALPQAAAEPYAGLREQIGRVLDELPWAPC